MRRACSAGVLALATLLACRAQEKPPDVSGLISDLRGADSGKSGQANLALIRIGEPAVPELIEMLKGEDPRLRGLAASTLWGMGPKGKAAVPALAETLSDKDPELRTAAAMALESMGGEARDAVPALARVLGDHDNRARQAAVKALGAIGPAAREALPALTRATKRISWPEAEEAIRLIQGR
ncbi:MAG TPA: HEAT repeat domain-containing protein [Vicinamibacteria bacterium]|jgi:HEAT repeat protein|nr:HEAT repeat domain-containing protein [Vicinamibacteria bacterium]